jgi:hypothetical protein
MMRGAESGVMGQVSGVRDQRSGNLKITVV